LVELQTAVRLEPGDAEAIGAIGAILAERGDMAGARAAFARARVLAPTDARLLGLIKHYTDRSIAGMGKIREGE
jgi:Flp pilus assembly protein TadD